MEGPVQAALSAKQDLRHAGIRDRSDSDMKHSPETVLFNARASVGKV